MLLNAEHIGPPPNRCISISVSVSQNTEPFRFDRQLSTQISVSTTNLYIHRNMFLSLQCYARPFALPPETLTFGLVDFKEAVPFKLSEAKLSPEEQRMELAFRIKCFQNYIEDEIMKKRTQILAMMMYEWNPFFYCMFRPIFRFGPYIIC
ncbi:hypothetical protein ACOME3_007224 [Neoechinorhynchus agilis]